jgi:prevent-host-death family protein
MSVIASRDLRNRTAEVLRRVVNGDRVTITVNAVAVAELAPLTPTRRPTISRAELMTLLARRQADAGLRDDLAELAADTAADLTSLQ